MPAKPDGCATNIDQSQANLPLPIFCATLVIITGRKLFHAEAPRQRDPQLGAGQPLHLGGAEGPGGAGGGQDEDGGEEPRDLHAGGAALLLPRPVHRPGRCLPYGVRQRKVPRHARLLALPHRLGGEGRRSISEPKFYRNVNPVSALSEFDFTRFPKIKRTTFKKVIGKPYNRSLQVNSWLKFYSMTAPLTVLSTLVSAGSSSTAVLPPTALYSRPRAGPQGGAQSWLGSRR